MLSNFVASIRGKFKSYLQRVHEVDVWIQSTCFLPVRKVAVIGGRLEVLPQEDSNLTAGSQVTSENATAISLTLLFPNDGVRESYKRSAIDLTCRAPGAPLKPDPCHRRPEQSPPRRTQRRSQGSVCRDKSNG